ncbi:MAG: response regulator transcription factor [Peptostreptococcaceae bacterium]|nr:response regulator transcription factor [Peptostreptococcaceae bacterium]
MEKTIYDCLIVDDEQSLLESTSEYLNLFGIRTATAGSAEECLHIVGENEIRLILLDINLGGDSGFELCRKLRELTQAPILFISARSSNDDVILALHIGGDDYIQKPYSLGVLLAKIKAVLKRNYPQTRDERVRFGSCSADLREERLYKGDQEIRLKGMERKLLFYLIKNAGRTLSKEEIFEKVWEESVTGDNTLNVHIRHLREKIEEDPNESQILRTVWGIGYHFHGEDLS